MSISKTRDTKRIPLAMVGTLSLLTLPFGQAYADDSSAANLAFRPAIEKARSAGPGSEAPGPNTPSSATLAFRPASEQAPRALAGSESPTTGTTAANLAFRPRGIEPVPAPEATTSYGSFAYRRPGSSSK